MQVLISSVHLFSFTMVPLNQIPLYGLLLAWSFVISVLLLENFTLLENVLQDCYGLMTPEYLFADFIAFLDLLFIKI